MPLATLKDSVPLAPQGVSPIGADGVLVQQRANGSAAGGLYLGGGAGASLGRHWLQARYPVARVHGSPLGFLLISAGTSF
jgi:hypothetical protein